MIWLILWATRWAKTHFIEAQTFVNTLWTFDTLYQFHAQTRCIFIIIIIAIVTVIVIAIFIAIAIAIAIVIVIVIVIIIIIIIIIIIFSIAPYQPKQLDRHYTVYRVGLWWFYTFVSVWTIKWRDSGNDW